MKKVEARILFNPHMMGRLMTMPHGGLWGNAEKYEKALNEEKELLLKIKAVDEEIVSKSHDQEAFDKTDENKPFPNRKNPGKSPAEKWAEIQNKIVALFGKKQELTEKAKKAAEKSELLKKNAELPTLSATQRKAAKEVAIYTRYKRRERIDNHAVIKGLINEGQGVEMYSELCGEQFEKNKERKDNEYFDGEIDIKIMNASGGVTEIPDIKCRETIDSFYDKLDEESSKADKYQGLSYCDLWGAERAKIINVLTNTPPQLINEKIKKAGYTESLKTESEEFEAPLHEVIRIARHNIFDTHVFFEFLTGELGGVQHISQIELTKFIEGTHQEEEAQTEFNKWVEVDFEDRFIIQVIESDPDEIRLMKSTLDIIRKYIADKFGIIHVDKLKDAKTDNVPY